MLLFVRGKGCDEYLTGEIIQPPAHDQHARTWKIENSMVISWLLNSMISEIGDNFMLYETAREIWEAVWESYSNHDNTSTIFEVESFLHELRQSEMNVTQYYNFLTRSWQQLDAFEDYQWSCSEDAKKFRTFVKQKRIFRFLLGLNKSLDEVRGRILGMKPLMGIREVFSEVPRRKVAKRLCGRIANCSIE